MRRLRSCRTRSFVCGPQTRWGLTTTTPRHDLGDARVQSPWQPRRDSRVARSCFGEVRARPREVRHDRDREAYSTPWAGCTGRVGWRNRISPDPALLAGREHAPSLLRRMSTGRCRYPRRPRARSRLRRAWRPSPCSPAAADPQRHRCAGHESHVGHGRHPPPGGGGQGEDASRSPGRRACADRTNSPQGRG